MGANPLDDIWNTRSIEQVMQNGVLYSGTDASRVWPNPAPAPRTYFMHQLLPTGY